MVFATGNNIAPFTQLKIRNSKNPSELLKRQTPRRSDDPWTKDAEESIEKIRQKLIGKIELSVSAYDTAWMALVPARESPSHPCFPQCLDWVMQNQHPNGSWGLDTNHPSLVKDSLSCTLASVLALQTWRVGDQLVKKGLDFLGSNSMTCSNNLQSSPVGFDLIFPSMISRAKELGLNLPLDSFLTAQMLRNRDLEIESLITGNRTCLAYVAEGLDKSHVWEDMINHQRSNGSLCNSPASTAAALIHLHDDKSLEYLHSLLITYGNAVPTYPNDLYTRLCMVNNLEKLGIHRYFQYEIENILDEIFRHWQEQSEDLFLDVACLAMAFRLLRMHGYEISSDALIDFVDQEHFMNTTSLQFRDTETFLELCRASKIKIYEHEPVLESIDKWTTALLEDELAKQEITDHSLRKEVEYGFEYSIHHLDRLVHRSNIELYDPNRIRMLKTSYWCSNIDNRDTHKFAVQDFNYCQTIHREEVKQLEKWVKDYKLDALDFDWHWLISSYFQICSLHYSPEQSDVRFLYATIGASATILDEIFDNDGSMEEVLNFIELFEKWDKDSAVYCSERIERLFIVFYDIFNEFADRAYIYQDRTVKHEILDQFKTYIRCCLREAEWVTYDIMPTFEEYSLNGIWTSGSFICAMEVYFSQEKLSEAAYKSEEYRTMFNLGGKLGRSLNDIQGLVREKTQRRLNSVSLLVNQSNGSLTEEDAVKELRRNIESIKREKLRMLLQKSLVPKLLKEFMFSFGKIYLYLYGGRSDEFRCPGITFDHINAVLYDPIHLPTDSIVEISD